MAFVWKYAILDIIPESVDTAKNASQNVKLVQLMRFVHLAMSISIFIIVNVPAPVRRIIIGLTVVIGNVTVVMLLVSNVQQAHLRLAPCVILLEHIRIFIKINVSQLARQKLTLLVSCVSHVIRHVKSVQVV